MTELNKGRGILNPMIEILQITLVLDVVNQHIKADCPNNQNKEKSARRRVKEAKAKEHTSHGKKIMYPHLVIPQPKVRKQICALW